MNNNYEINNYNEVYEKKIILNNGYNGLPDNNKPNINLRTSKNNFQDLYLVPEMYLILDNNASIMVQ